MNSLTAFVRIRQLPIYFILAYVFAWVFYPLIAINPVFGLPALFAPALAAVIVTWLAGGRQQVSTLLSRLVIWRVHLIWYILALALPVALSYLISLLSRFFVGDFTLEWSPITPLALVVFVLVIGEEIGWRGYAQIRLEESFSPVIAAVILGVLWGCWHLPAFFIPGMPQYGLPFLPFVLWTIALSILAAWLLKNARASVLIATLFHGATNTFGFLVPNLDPTEYRWLMALVYGLAALLVVIIFGPKLTRARLSRLSGTSLTT